MRIGYSQRGGWFGSMGCLGWLLLAVVVIGGVTALIEAAH